MLYQLSYLGPQAPPDVRARRRPRRYHGRPLVGKAAGTEQDLGRPRRARTEAGTQAPTARRSRQMHLTRTDVIASRIPVTGSSWPKHESRAGGGVTERETGQAPAWRANDELGGTNARLTRE